MGGGQDVNVVEVKKEKEYDEKEYVDEIEEVQVLAKDQSTYERYEKFDEEIGRDSFKTIFKGLDRKTEVAVAWCQLQGGTQLVQGGG